MDSLVDYLPRHDVEHPTFDCALVIKHPRHRYQFGRGAVDGDRYMDLERTVAAQGPSPTTSMTTTLILNSPINEWIVIASRVPNGDRQCWSPYSPSADDHVITIEMVSRARHFHVASGTTPADDSHQHLLKADSMVNSVTGVVTTTIVIKHPQSLGMAIYASINWGYYPDPIRIRSLFPFETPTIANFAIADDPDGTAWVTHPQAHTTKLAYGVLLHRTCREGYTFADIRHEGAYYQRGELGRGALHYAYDDVRDISSSSATPSRLAPHLATFRMLLPPSENLVVQWPNDSSMLPPVFNTMTIRREGATGDVVLQVQPNDRYRRVRHVRDPLVTLNELTQDVMVTIEVRHNSKFDFKVLAGRP